MSQPKKPGEPSPAVERSGTLMEPDANLSIRHPAGQQPIERSGTVLETDDDIRQAVLSGHKGQQPGAAVTVGPPPPSPAAQAPAPSARGAIPFRPTARPPVAILTVFDDGKTDGEMIRIRDHRFVIGRSEGDLVIPVDGRISVRHVEITHQVVGGLHRWVVTDLQSTHGLFVRVSRTVLADKSEFLVGNGRYRFDAAHVDAGETIDEIPHEGRFGETHGWSEGQGPMRPPAVTELLGKDIGNRVLLVKNEYWIGSDPSCSICRPDDPFCERRHVRLYRGGSRGGWHAEHPKTQNGLWMRMPQVTVESTAQFQIGEQRFQLKVK
jgi:hypothetical protein